MSKMKGFFAYQSYPKALNETIDRAIEKLNQSGIMEIKSWKELNITGNYIINKILSEIDSCELFICDLTYLNFNVLFELGYAIAKNKKIWIVLDPSVENSKKDYEKLKMLTTIGYSSYTNSLTLTENFYKEKPYTDLEKTILNEFNGTSVEKKKLLYLKSTVDTDSSLQLSVALKDSLLPSLIDDPRESSTQPLEWYIKNLNNALGVVVHFLSDTHVDNSVPHAKYSLISGLAHGMEVPLLMLAHDPFKSPIDYRDILKIHSTSDECKKYAKEWLSVIEEEFGRSKDNYSSHLKDKKAINELKSLFIGEPIAEHERDELVQYFVETHQYLEAMNSKQTLFIGRKGTGKTANLLKIADELSQDKRNLVCVVQPVGHEIDGVLNMLKQSISKSEKGYLVESIWKYLICTELANSVYKSLINRPNSIPKSTEEQELVEFVEKNEKMINADFTLRLENAVNSLCGLSEYKSIESQRVKISEILHSNIIAQLRKMLGDVLHQKHKVCILIDNLDASWNRRSDLEELCELLFGLLNVAREISDEFHGADYRHKSVNLSLIAFLRSDIFTQILTYANERDKIQHSKLIWHDPDMLFRVIESRFEFSVDTISSPKELWERFFCSHVDGVPLKQYVTELIIPRPRDIIWLFRAAIQEAVNRGHTKVQESDFKSAEFKYSQYALDSLLAENGNRVDDLESLLYEFAGAPEIITIDEVEENLKKAGITNIIEVTDLLCELTFLGLETGQNKFEFINEQRSKRLLYKLAERTVQQSESKIQKFKINRAFHSYLDIISIESV